jgi:hypothetical protein
MTRTMLLVVLLVIVATAPAHARLYHGQCTNAFTAVQRHVVFQGRVRAGTLVGRLHGRTPCPRGAVHAPCQSQSTFVHCAGTVGTQGCTFEGDLYGHMFEGDYTCPGPNLTGALSFH